MNVYCGKRRCVGTIVFKTSNELNAFLKKIQKSAYNKCTNPFRIQFKSHYPAELKIISFGEHY
jgi:hypothetical protein